MSDPHVHHHDHGICVTDALTRAADRCASVGARLTPQRREVLELVWSSHKPIGAYDILAAMSRDGRRVAPPTVYRALDFLIAHGLVHRVASKNAFFGCPDPGHEGAREIFICTECGHATEVSDPDLSQAVNRHATRMGFAVARQTIEVLGRCAACQRS